MHAQSLKQRPKPQILIFSSGLWSIKPFCVRRIYFPQQLLPPGSHYAKIEGRKKCFFEPNLDTKVRTKWSEPWYSKWSLLTSSSAEYLAAHLWDLFIYKEKKRNTAFKCRDNVSDLNYNWNSKVKLRILE